MSDLISRQSVKNLITMKPYDWSNITERRAMLLEIDKLPSIKPEERTAKVIMRKYWLGVSLNVVGQQTIGYEWLCEKCKKKVIDGDDYCSHCGSKLIWGEEND